jgi:cytochrome c-type biogenesis protein CcmE
LKSLEENVVYFKSPTEIKILSEIKEEKIRVGGMVKINSISIKTKEVKFIITDFKNEINVLIQVQYQIFLQKEKELLQKVI